MNDVLARLRHLLVDDYRGLRERLARRFGSADFASEVLHEAWLRLSRPNGGASVAVHNPKAYLYRVALNIATDRQRAEKVRVTAAQLDDLYRQAEDELDPGRIAEARSELAVLARAIDTLPERRRAVFLAARLEELPYKIIAARLGVTVRVVEREIKLALDHLADVMQTDVTEKNEAAPRGTAGREPSSE